MVHGGGPRGRSYGWSVVGVVVASVVVRCVLASHAAPPRSPVRVKNRSSRSAPPSRSSSSTCCAAAATRPTCSGWRRRAEPPSVGVTCRPAPRSAAASACAVEPADERALAGEQHVEALVGDDAAAADDDEAVDRGLHLAEQVAGQQHRAAAAGEVLQEVAHPADALGVHAVGRLVEDQDLGVAEQGGADAEPLAHAQRVVADPPLGRRRASPTRSSISSAVRRGRPRSIDARRSVSWPVRPGCWAAASSITPTTRPGLGSAAYGRPPMVGAPGRRRGQAGDGAQRGRLAGAVRAEEAGDGAGPDGEGDVVDGDVVAVALGEVFDGDHGSIVRSRRRGGASAARRRDHRRKSMPASPVVDLRRRPRSLRAP